MKCPHCGNKIVKWPIRDENGNLIVKNLFKMDGQSLAWLLIILVIAFSFKAATADCKKIIENPCKVCKDVNCGVYVDEEKETFVYIDSFNITNQNVKW
jgi:hypothetical protein